LTKWFKLIGEVSVFGVRAIRRSFRPPFELQSLRDEIEEVGSRSLSLVVASGFALGVVMTLHTRSTLVMFGAAAMIPGGQSLAFLVEIGSFFAGLLVA
jgi:phospholipid/cholesterol/gamma-HCH transport system permease protein